MSLNGLTESGSLNYNEINETIYPGIRAQETQIRATIATIGSNGDGAVSQADMLILQQQIQQWTLLIDVQSNIVKSVADSLKSVVQKSS